MTTIKWILNNENARIYIFIIFLAAMMLFVSTLVGASSPFDSTTKTEINQKTLLGDNTTTVNSTEANQTLSADHLTNISQNAGNLVIQDFELTNTAGNTIIPGQVLRPVIDICGDFNPPETLNIRERDGFANDNEIIESVSIVSGDNVGGECREYDLSNGASNSDVDEPIDITYFDYLNGAEDEGVLSGPGSIDLFVEVPTEEEVDKNNVELSLSRDLESNTAPAAEDIFLTVPEDETVSTSDTTFSDPDKQGINAPLSVSIETPPSNGNVEINEGEIYTLNDWLEYTPSSGFTGTDSFEYEVSDGDKSDTGQVTIEVVDPDRDNDGIRNGPDDCPNSAEDNDGYEDGDGCPENPSPSVSLSNEQVNEGGSVTLSANADDPEGESLDYDWSHSGAGSISGGGSSVTYDAPSGISSDTSATVSVTVSEDDAGKSAGASATVSVDDDTSNNDPDGDGIPNSEDDCNNDPEDEDGYKDGDGCPENPGPSVSLSDTQVSEGGSVTLSATADDPEGEPLDYDWSHSGAGSISGGGSSVTYDAPSGISSDTSATVSVTVSEDDAGKSAGASATVTVNDDTSDNDPDGDGIPNSEDDCPNDAEDNDGYQDGDGCPENPGPSVSLSDTQVSEGGSVTLSATADDPEGESLDYDWSRSGAGSISGGGSSVTYNAPTSISSDTSASVSVTVSEDDTGKSAQASATVTVTQNPDPTNFAVSNLQPANATVVSGAVIRISADVQNTGDQQGTQDIVLTAGGLTEVQSETLSAGESTTITFSSIDTGALGPGSYTHEIASADDSVSGSLTVQQSTQPANFEVRIDSTNKPTEGDDLNVRVTIENTGGQQGTQTVDLTVGEVLNPLGTDLTEVTLAGGKSTTKTLSIGTGSGDAGSYTAQVTSENDSASTSVTVDSQTPTQSLEFNDQNLGQDDSVLVENVDTGGVLSAILVTYTIPNSGDIIVAGVVPPNSVSDGDISVEMKDTGGFPGTHTAHILPAAGASQPYQPGDVLSSSSESSITDSETASISESPQSGEVNLEVEPRTDVIASGGTRTYDVVVDGPDGGIGAYGEIAIDIEDSSVAKIVGFTETRVELSNSQIQNNGQRLLLYQALLDSAYSAQSKITIASFEIKAVGDSGESTAIRFDQSANQNIVYNGGNVGIYSINEFNGATVSVGSGSDGNSSLNPFVAQYDANDDGSISVTELGEAASNFAANEISVTQLGEVASAFAQN